MNKYGVDGEVSNVDTPSFMPYKMYTPDQTMQEIVQNLLRDATRHYENKEGGRLWRAVDTLSVFLEGYMTDEVVKSNIDLKTQLEQELEDLQGEDKTRDIKKVRKEEILLTYGRELFMVCIRIFTSCPLTEASVVSTLEVGETMQDIEESLSSKVRNVRETVKFVMDRPDKP